MPLTVYLYEAVSEAIRQAGDFYEAELLDELRERFPTQRTIVDVGANIGNHAAYWSAFVPHTTLHAFEPVPDNYELLLLNAPGAVCHPSALSDNTRRVAIEVDWQNMGRSHIARHGEYKVMARTLDSFGLDDVTLMKIDTEGHERQIVFGARHTIARCHPAIVVEDGLGWFDHYLWAAGIEGYRQTAAWAGANSLWEWA